MASAERSVEIDVTPNAFYSVITDFESYPDFIPVLTSIEIEDHRKEGKTEIFRVANHVHLMKKRFSYTLELRGVKGKSLEWDMLEGDLLKKNSGYWRLSANGKKGTKAVYGVTIEVGRLVPKAIVSTMVEADLPRMLGAFKDHAEGR